MNNYKIEKMSGLTMKVKYANVEKCQMGTHSLSD